MQLKRVWALCTKQFHAEILDVAGFRGNVAALAFSV